MDKTWTQMWVFLTRKPNNGINLVHEGALMIAQRLFMWRLETQLFASSYIWLTYIFEASYSTVVTSVSKKSSVDQSELEK